MRLYTIGFAGRSAESFFTALEQAGVRTLVDIRLRPAGQLAGFARAQDLPYFLRKLVPGCSYRHQPELAPSDEILKAYRKSRDWDAYVTAFEQLMDQRGIPGVLTPEDFEDACLLCSEKEHAHCHRSLVASRLQQAWPDVTVIHL